jgi:hypothetical protein
MMPKSHENVPRLLDVALSESEQRDDRRPLHVEQRLSIVQIGGVSKPSMSEIAAAALRSVIFSGLG